MRAFIEHVMPNRIDGWAYKDDAPDERLVMELLLEGRVIATALAKNFREDLRRSGVGDGCYGYVFEDVQIADLPKLYIGQQLSVRAKTANGSIILAESADYLRAEIEGFLQRQVLESSTFDDFIAFIISTQSLDPEIAGKSLNLLNSSRAHFSEWTTSSDFLRVGKNLAKYSNRPHTESFYETKLKELNESGSPSRVGEGVHLAPFPETYGAPRRDAVAVSQHSLEILEPRFLTGGHRTSFLQEAGIIQESSGFPKIKILAFREDAFGGSSWWITKSGGEQLPVARNLYYLDFELLRSVLDQAGFLIIDMSNEGPLADPNWIAILNKAVVELQIDPRQIILVNQNLRFGLGSVENKFLGHVAIAHFFISKSISVLKRLFPSPHELLLHYEKIFALREKVPAETLKHFICLNFTPRWFRWATVLHLSSRGLLKKGHVSFPGQTNCKLQNALDLDSVIPQLRMRKELLLEVPSLLAKCPLQLDIHGPTSTSPDFEYPLQFMTESLFHIVTESEMSDGNGMLRVTEKILKPIVGLQPFVVIGNPGSLALMKNMGFRTFGNLVDEGYDDIESPAARLEAVFDEIDRLTSMPIDELRQSIQALRETLIHNLRHLMIIGPLIFNNAAEYRLHQIIE